MRLTLKHFLTVCFIFFSCVSTFISDTLLSEDKIVIPADYPIYDDKKVGFIADVSEDLVNKYPGSLRGGKKYIYEELRGRTGVVEGEYALPFENYYIIRLEDGSLTKIPACCFA